MANWKVLLVMRKQSISDGMILEAGEDTHFEMIAVQMYDLACLTADNFSPDIAVVEITESGQHHQADKCLAVLDAIRGNHPACKRVIICSKSDEESYQAAIAAKQEGRIDGFLLFDHGLKEILGQLEALMTKAVD